MKVVFSLLLVVILGVGLALSGSHAMAAPPGAPSAQIVSYGTDRDTYNRGDTASGHISLKNTGSTAINDVTVSVTVARSVPAVGSVALGTRDFTISGLNIPPGETRTSEFSVSIPREFSGISTAGDYDIKGNVRVGGNEVGSFTKHVRVI